MPSKLNKGLKNPAEGFFGCVDTKILILSLLIMLPLALYGPLKTSHKSSHNQPDFQDSSRCCWQTGLCNYPYCFLKCHGLARKAIRNGVSQRSGWILQDARGNESKADCPFPRGAGHRRRWIDTRVVHGKPCVVTEGASESTARSWSS